MDFMGCVIIGVFLLFLFGIIIPIICHDLRLVRDRKGGLTGSTPLPEAKPAELPNQSSTEQLSPAEKGKLYEKALRQRKKTREKQKAKTP